MLKQLILCIIICLASNIINPNSNIIDPNDYIISKFIKLPEMVVNSEYLNYDKVIDVAKLISGEAANQPLDGMVAVGNVVINRALYKRISIYRAIRQKGIFDGYGTRHWKRYPATRTIEAAKLALKGYQAVPITVHYFHNPTISTDREWVSYISKYSYKIIADHEFCHNPDLINKE